jgi:hypothetical protein
VKDPTGEAVADRHAFFRPGRLIGRVSSGAPELEAECRSPRKVVPSLLLAVNSPV